MSERHESPEELMEYVEEVARRMPEVTDALRRQGRDLEDRLPYMWIEGFQRYVLERFRRARADVTVEVEKDPWLRQALDVVEEGMTSPYDTVREMVRVGVLELIWHDEPGIVHMLGPSCREYVERERREALGRKRRSQ